jgi:hypothetical protein
MERTMHRELLQGRCQRGYGDVEAGYFCRLNETFASLNGNSDGNVASVTLIPVTFADEMKL